MNEQRCMKEGGGTRIHREKPSRLLTRAKITYTDVENGWDGWENDIYYGTLRRYSEGFPIGGGPYMILGISAIDESARHDWRDFQKIKNDLVGKEWEAVELYPAESRLVDPSNRFYLWCVPQGVFTFGWKERKVQGPVDMGAPQRPFTPAADARADPADAPRGHDAPGAPR